MGHEALGARVDAIEQLAGAFQTMSVVAAIRREIAKLKPMIKTDIARSPGVLLVVRMESIGIGGGIQKVQCVCYGGPASQPEVAIGRWRSDPHYFPKISSFGSVNETFLWVVKQKDMAQKGNKAPGYYPSLSDKPAIKYLCYETDVATL
jgi:hypothetical protein